MIKEVKIIQINQKDELRITVDKISDTIIYKSIKELNDNETLWVKIYDDGHAIYGLDMRKDPIHNNQPYTWSSRCEVINEYFKFDGTIYQLARYDVGLRDNEQNSYWSCGMTLDKVVRLAAEKEDDLRFGLQAFIDKEK